MVPNYSKLINVVISRQLWLLHQAEGRLHCWGHRPHSHPGTVASVTMASHHPFIRALINLFRFVHKRKSLRGRGVESTGERGSSLSRLLRGNRSTVQGQVRLPLQKRATTQISTSDLVRRHLALQAVVSLAGGEDLSPGEVRRLIQQSPELVRLMSTPKSCTLLHSGYILPSSLSVLTQLPWQK